MATITDTTATEPAFVVERFSVSDGRVEVAGHWRDVRGRRFVRPVLWLQKGESRQRLMAVLDHKPWAADDGEPWLAAFKWEGGKLDVDRAELEVGRELIVELPLPGGRTPKPRPAKPRPPSELDRVREQLLSATKERENPAGRAGRGHHPGRRARPPARRARRRARGTRERGEGAPRARGGAGGGESRGRGAHAAARRARPRARGRRAGASRRRAAGQRRVPPARARAPGRRGGDRPGAQGRGRAGARQRASSPPPAKPTRSSSNASRAPNRERDELRTELASRTPDADVVAERDELRSSRGAPRRRPSPPSATASRRARRARPRSPIIVGRARPTLSCRAGPARGGARRSRGRARPARGRARRGAGRAGAARGRARRGAGRARADRRRARRLMGRARPSCKRACRRAPRARSAQPRTRRPPVRAANGSRPSSSRRAPTASTSSASWATCGRSASGSRSGVRRRFTADSRLAPPRSGIGLWVVRAVALALVAILLAAIVLLVAGVR